MATVLRASINGLAPYAGFTALGLKKQAEGGRRRLRPAPRCNRFRQWHDAGVFEALMEGLIAQAAKRGEVDLSLVGTDSTTARARHDAVGGPAATVPTCANAASRRSSRRRRTRPPAGRRRAPEAAGPSAATPASTRSGTPSSRAG
ncbi:hypothetical protein GCM10010231_14750 [Streptomyces sindenensis]|nr:hypothetical protein GCM10010231_14750 [Streptomyces sindenensis]